MHFGIKAAAARMQPVFFMTNRQANPGYGNSHDPEKAYLADQRMQVDSVHAVNLDKATVKGTVHVDSAFDCGFVEVKVPESHKPGAEAKHFTLSHYEKMPAGPRPDTGGVTASALPALATPESFTDSIFSSLEATSGEVVLFIHGFDESWPNAIKKAAQLTWDTSQASPAAAAGGTPADGDNANGKRVALAFDWAPSGHSGPFTFTPYKGEKGINAAQDHLPHLLQILEKLMLHDQQEARDQLNAALTSLGSGKGSPPYPFVGEDIRRLLELETAKRADRDTVNKDQGGGTSGDAEWTAAYEQLAQQARRFKALHIVADGMGGLVLQRGLSNALLVPGVGTAPVAASAALQGLRKPCTNLLLSLADGGVRLTITLLTPDVDHASMNILLNNLGPTAAQCPLNLYVSRGDKKDQAGCYSWGLTGAAGHSHACHVYLHPAVNTIKLSGAQGHGYVARHEGVLRDLADIFAGRGVAERNLAVVSPDDTKCLTCSDRVRLLMASAGPPLFRLMPHAAAAPADSPRLAAAAAVGPEEPAAAAVGPGEPAAAAVGPGEPAAEELHAQDY